MVCLLAAAFLIALTLAGYEIFGEHARHLIANHGGTLGTTLRR